MLVVIHECVISMFAASLSNLITRPEASQFSSIDVLTSCYNIVIYLLRLDSKASNFFQAPLLGDFKIELVHHALEGEKFKVCLHTF